MHELGLTRNIVSIVREHASGRQVNRVRLAIGPLACIEKQAIEFCFDLVVKDTELAKAKLEFVEGEGDTFLIKEYELEEIT